LWMVLGSLVRYRIFHVFTTLFQHAVLAAFA
jgi:hypothetical protein